MKPLQPMLAAAVVARLLLQPPLLRLRQHRLARQPLHQHPHPLPPRHPFWPLAHLRKPGPLPTSTKSRTKTAA